MPGEQITPPINLSLEQKFRLRGVLLHEKIVREDILAPKQQILECEKSLTKLRPQADQMAENGDVPQMLFQAIRELERQIEFANHKIQEAPKRLESIRPMLNGKSVEGWGGEDPFGEYEGTSLERMIYLVLQGKAITPKDCYH